MNSGKNSKSHNTSSDTTGAVDQFMATLEHPYKSEVQALRELVLSVDPTVREGIKWNAPSYRTTEYFATTNLRVKGGVGVILHLGAKVRDIPIPGLAIADPDKILKWLSKDRASVEFHGAAEIKQKAVAFQAILRQWIRHV